MTLLNILDISDHSSLKILKFDKQQEVKPNNKHDNAKRENLKEREKEIKDN